ncbi:hypothetical protein [Vibrio parahaemolyticus]|uniref:hypothetical protein n=1 Tax=Vibrio parahaemolyticus TaxID=670 RepID=UPI000AAA1274|nr:hypothetical protein [Vibrio parahaemolyticus]
MGKLVQNVKLLVASLVNGVSAVCSGVVATGVAAGLSLESGSSLGFHLNSFSFL